MHSRLPLVLLVSLLPFVVSTSSKGPKDCGKGEFWYSDKSCCLPNGGPTKPSSPPQGSDCPSSYYWGKDQDCCVPREVNPPSAPQCKKGWSWNSNAHKCLPASPSPPSTGPQTCKKDQFWWSDKDCCLPNGGPSKPPPPPTGSDCPPSYYWGTEQNCCVPRNNPPPQPQCKKDWSWNPTSHKCLPTTGPGNCKNNEFWWNDKNCCLPRGGPSRPPSPPSGSNCPPDTHYWGSQQGCCVPRNPTPPNSPNPQCPKKWTWYSALHKCSPTPTPPTPPPSHPSKGFGWHGKHKRDLKSRLSLCPAGLEACPIKGHIGGDFECLDTTSELESCGGCASIGKGQDCTSIEGAWNVGCEQGTCIIYTCAAGFQVSHDGKSCRQL